MVSICVVSGGPLYDERTKELSSQLTAPYELSTPSRRQEDQSLFLQNFDLFLDVGESLVLRSQTGLRFNIDFDTDKRNYQKKQLGKKDLLPRALGIDKDILRAHDLSCGLARDALILTMTGFRVTACERSDVLYLLLTEAQKKTSRPDVHSIKFVHQEARDYLRSLPNSALREDSFYFDPMFPEKKKEALPKKEMQLFKILVGEDEDAHLVVQAAAELKVSRFVVKRPLKAKPLFEKPHHDLQGKLIRYDIYLF